MYENIRVPPPTGGGGGGRGSLSFLVWLYTVVLGLVVILCMSRDGRLTLDVLLYCPVCQE